MRDFLDLAAERASVNLKGIASSNRVDVGLKMSTRSDLQVVVLCQLESWPEESHWPFDLGRLQKSWLNGLFQIEQKREFETESCVHV